MIRLEIILTENDVIAISEALKKIPVSGVLAHKVKGRDKFPRPEIHAAKGSEIFTPQFGPKHVMNIVIPDEKKDEVVKIVREYAKSGLIFVHPVNDVIDIESGKNGSDLL